MTCPTSATTAAATFAHDVSATAPYSVAIDYGDGRTYTGDDAHLPGVFSHTYARSGSFTVVARLTDAVGQVADARCSFSWARPVAAESRTRSGGGTSGSGGSVSSGGSDDHYTNSDGDSVHRPEFADAAPAGASAQCRDGSYSFSRHRSGTCSHHGGVASWL